MKRFGTTFLVLVVIYSIAYTFLVFTLIDAVKRNPALIALLAPMLPLACIATYALLTRQRGEEPIVPPVDPPVTKGSGADTSAS